MRFGWNSQASSQNILRMAGILSLAWILFYIYIYWFQPFPDFWNNFFSNFFTQVASLVAAVFATLIMSYYDRSDGPRRVWGWFAVALWLWFAAELSWGYLYMTVSEVPTGLPDVFWVISYFLLSVSLIHQFRLLTQPSRLVLWNWLGIALVLLITLTWVIYLAVTSISQAPASLDTVINSFYPAADLVMAIIALSLARHFQGGAFARPWLGLLVFTFADLLYAWLEASGMYAWSLAKGNVLTTIADVAYLGSYLVLGLAVLTQWLFLKYGLRTPLDTR